MTSPGGISARRLGVHGLQERFHLALSDEVGGADVIVALHLGVLTDGVDEFVSEGVVKVDVAAPLHIGALS